MIGVVANNNNNLKQLDLSADLTGRSATDASTFPAGKSMTKSVQAMNFTVTAKSPIAACGNANVNNIRDKMMMQNHTEQSVANLQNLQQTSYEMSREQVFSEQPRVSANFEGHQDERSQERRVTPKRSDL